MKPVNYWIKHAEETLIAGEKKGDVLNKELLKVYGDTERELKKELDAFYGRYASENKINISDAKKHLNSSELIDFKANMEQYFTQSKALGLGKEYQGYLRDVSSRVYISRQQELLIQVRHKVEVLFGKQEQMLDNTLSHVFEDSYYRTIFNLQQSLGVGKVFSTLPVNVIDQIVKTPWLGDSFSSRIWKNKAKLIQELEQIIPRAFSVGKNSKELGKELAHKLGVSSRAGERLVRTEVNHASNTASMHSYKEYGVEKYQFIATLDNRTSEICAALDNKVFLVSDAYVGINYPPMHPNCRSTTVPYFEPDELDGELLRAARDKDGKYYTVPASMNYSQWKLKHIEDALTPAKIYAINKYISPFSYIINEKFRSSTPLTKEEKVIINNLDSALKDMPQYAGTVNRSVFIDNKEDLLNFLREYAENSTITYPAYTSASKDVYDENDTVRLVIKAKSVPDISSFNAGEMEVLFPRNSTFRIQDMKIVDGKPYIYLERINHG